MISDDDKDFGFQEIPESMYLKLDNIKAPEKISFLRIYKCFKQF